MVEPAEPSKILFVGDSHGNYHFFREAVDKALELGCQTIVQLGDFGFWEPYSDGKEYLDNVARALKQKNLECVWIDGNHESHSYLRAHYVKDQEGFVSIRPSLWYAQRGLRWTWRNTRFLALGGAYSIDENYRTWGVDWWPEETITYAEAQKAIDGGPADIMLCHDAPLGVEGLAGETEDRQKDLWPKTVSNRTLLRSVFDEVQPKLVVHGHWHKANVFVLKQALVVGLDCDINPNAAWMSYDLTA